MKKFLVMILMVAIAATMGFASGAEEKAVELRLAHYNPEADAMHLSAVMLAENVAKRTNGKVKITIFPAAKLGNSQELNEQCKLGAIDLVLPTEPALAKYVQKVLLVTGPFAFKDYANVDKFFAGDAFVNWIKKDLNAAGFEYIARWEYGFRTYTNSVKPLNTPADFKGLKIRTPPDFVNQATVGALGGTAQTIAFTELPMALKQGVVDGQENPIGTIYSNKFYELQKYLSILNYTYNATHLLMNKAAFDKLSPNAQKILIEEAQKAGEFDRKSIREDVAKQIADMKSKGMEVNYPDLAPFQAAAAPVWDELKAKVTEADWKTFQDMLAKSK